MLLYHDIILLIEMTIILSFGNKNLYHIYYVYCNYLVIIMITLKLKFKLEFKTEINIAAHRYCDRYIW